MAITHAYVSTKADPSDSSLVGKSKWNDFHNDALDVITKSAAYTLGTVATDEFCLVDDEATITLPTAVGITGKVYAVKRTNASGDVTIATTSAQTIDGEATYVLTYQYEVLAVISDGSNWLVL